MLYSLMSCLVMNNLYFREKKKYEVQIEKVVHMVQKKDREIASLKQVINR